VPGAGHNFYCIIKNKKVAAQEREQQPLMGGGGHKFKINIVKYPTLSSLAFTIFASPALA
jgi:hypothetical protein